VSEGNRIKGTRDIRGESSVFEVRDGRDGGLMDRAELSGEGVCGLERV
jgi:hypothetical protein